MSTNKVKGSTILLNKIILLMLLSILSSCAYYSPIYWGWGEWSGSNLSGMENQPVSKFEWSRLPGVITMIDGDTVGSGYKKAKLLPGIHKIDYAYSPAQFGTHPRGSFEMELKAGHLYEFRIKLCFSCNPRRYDTWVMDKTTGDIVWGQIKSN